MNITFKQDGERTCGQKMWDRLAESVGEETPISQPITSSPPFGSTSVAGKQLDGGFQMFDGFGLRLRRGGQNARQQLMRLIVAVPYS